MRIGAWLAISAVVYRWAGKSAFALLSLVQATVGILEYTSLGLGPAMIHLAARARVRTDSRRSGEPALDSSQKSSTSAGDIDLPSVYVNGFLVALIGAWLAAAALAAWLVLAAPGDPGGQTRTLVGLIGGGTIIRLVSDAPAAILQTAGRIAMDNALLAGAEIVWAVGSIAGIVRGRSWDASVGISFMAAAAGLLALRLLLAQRFESTRLDNARQLVSIAIIRRLLAFGLLVVAAQAADYLYAPTDCILITWLLGRSVVADYSPAIQVDGGLLLLASGVAAVLLPRTAVAHATGDPGTARRYYIRGTLATVLLLAAAAPAAWWLAPYFFRIWLHDPMPATQAILPLVLIHTVLGGSSTVGRSVLLAIGKTRAVAASALIGGVINVAASYALARYTHLGLTGIVLGTLIAVTARCVIWMPWYVLKSLGRETVARNISPPN